MGDVITICNNKGGVGKTFMVWAMATYLRERYNASVCCIDLDNQGSLSNTLIKKYLGMEDDNDLFEIQEYSGTPAKNLFLTQTDLGKIRPMTNHQGIDFFYTEPNDYSAIDIFNPRPGEEDRMEHFARALDLLRPKYDYILLDVPPAANRQKVTAIYLADYVVIPLQCASHSTIATEGEIDMLQRVGCLDKFLGIVINHVQRHSMRHRRKVAKLRRVFGEVFFKTTIHISVAIDTATDLNVPLTSVPGGYTARREVEAVLEEILERIAQKKAQNTQDRR